MKIMGNPGVAWLLLTISLGIHILDEARNDFLPIYNAIARISGSLPVLTYSEWITSLIIMLIILTGMTYFAFKNLKWMCYVSFFYAAVMIIHGFGHLAISDYFNEASAGFYSSFLLFISALYLIWKAWKRIRFLKLE